MLKILYRLNYWTMLSTNYRNNIIDICCRMISTDGEVGLDERIWMSKLCEHNEQARRIRDEMLRDYKTVSGNTNKLDYILRLC